MEVAISVLAVVSLLLGIWAGRKFFNKSEITLYIVYSLSHQKLNVFGSYTTYEKAREARDSVLEQLPNENILFYIETISI